MYISWQLIYLAQDDTLWPAEPKNWQGQLIRPRNVNNNDNPRTPRPSHQPDAIMIPTQVQPLALLPFLVSPLIGTIEQTCIYQLVELPGDSACLKTCHPAHPTRVELPAGHLRVAAQGGQHGATGVAFSYFFNSYAWSSCCGVCWPVIS